MYLHNILVFYLLTVFTVVIDPGHGGKDPGAVSADGATKEKVLALDISKKLAKRINENMPDVKVIMTRVDDTYPTLSQRSSICNRNNADLFLSVHINSAKRLSARGFSTHILGESERKDNYALNMEICKRENSVVCDYENFDPQAEGFDPRNPEASSIIFSLMQNAYLEQSMIYANDMNLTLVKTQLGPGFGTLQSPFQLLWQTSCPSVLVECGFISNQDDLKYIRTEDGRQEIADALFDAFVNYKRRYDASVGSGADTPPQQPAAQTAAVPETAVQPQALPEPAAQPAEPAVTYAIQLVSSTRVIPVNDLYFKGLPVQMKDCGSIRKYIVYESSDLEKLCADHSDEIKKMFPDAFVVKLESGCISFFKKL